MIDREYAHRIQFHSEWVIEDESEGTHTIDIYDASVTTLVDYFIKFIAAEYEFNRSFVIERVIEHLSEQ